MNLTETQRGWIYRIAVGLGVILFVVGLVTEEQLLTYIGIAQSVLANGLASVKTPVRVENVPE